METEPRPVHMRQLRLSLFRSDTESLIALSSAVERLLAWPSHRPSTICFLKSVELWFDDSVLEQWLVDRAFCLLALHKGLEQLSLCNGCYAVSL